MLAVVAALAVDLTHLHSVTALDRELSRSKKALLKISFMLVYDETLARRTHPRAPCGHLHPSNPFHVFSSLRTSVRGYPPCPPYTGALALFGAVVFIQAEWFDDSQSASCPSIEHDGLGVPINTSRARRLNFPVFLAL